MDGGDGVGRLIGGWAGPTSDIVNNMLLHARDLGGLVDVDVGSELEYQFVLARAVVSNRSCTMPTAPS